jgi:ribosomal protein S18 acetylase RimI-like enzyme
MIEYKITEQPAHDELEKLSNALYSYNVERLGAKYQKILLLIAAYHNNNFIAGLEAVIKAGFIYIDKLWVDKQYRSQGVGKKLLLEVEKIAQKNNIDYLQLQTGTFQEGLGFYQKMGFEIFAEYPIKYNKIKHTSYMLQKFL